jgi:hypothetical protein
LARVSPESLDLRPGMQLAPGLALAILNVAASFTLRKGISLPSAWVGR